MPSSLGGLSFCTSKVGWRAANLPENVIHCFLLSRRFMLNSIRSSRHQKLAFTSIRRSRKEKVVATTGVLLSAVEFFTRRLEQLAFCSVIHFLVFRVPSYFSFEAAVVRTSSCQGYTKNKRVSDGDESGRHFENNLETVGNINAIIW